MSDILNALKFIGLAISLGATVWGLISKTTFEDEAGQKHLTRAGRVSIALAMGSFLVAALAQVFQIAADRSATARRLASELQSEQRQKRTLELQTLADARSRAESAEQRANTIGQRLLALQIASESRARDTAIARDVNSGAARNLIRAELALKQIARVLYPLPRICAQVRWRIPAGTQGLNSATQRLQGLARARAADETMFPVGVSGSADLARIEPDSPYFPRSGEPAEDSLFSVLNKPHAELAFLTQGSEIETIVDPLTRRPDSRRADLAFTLDWKNSREGELRTIYNGDDDRASYAVFWFDADRSEVNFVTNWATLVSESPTGKIISVPDLQTSTMVLWMDNSWAGENNNLFRALIPEISWIRVGTRTYNSHFNSQTVHLIKHRTNGFAYWVASNVPLQADDLATPQCGDTATYVAA